MAPFHPSVNNSSYFPGPQPPSRRKPPGPPTRPGPLPDQRPLFILHVTAALLAGAGYCDNLLFVSVRSAGAVRPLRRCPGRGGGGADPAGTATCPRSTDGNADAKQKATAEEEKERIGAASGIVFPASTLTSAILNAARGFLRRNGSDGPGRRRTRAPHQSLV